MTLNRSITYHYTGFITYHNLDIRESVTDKYTNKGVSVIKT